jgi:hypothetical protein
MNTMWRSLHPVMLLCALLLCIPPACAAVDGIVINGGAGKPAPNTLVTLVQPGMGGMRTLGTTKSDGAGRFKFDKSGEAGGPQLIQAIYDGVLYTHMIPPGSPTSGVHILVYDATKDAKIATVEQHAIFLQPGAEEIDVAENILFKNDSKQTFNDPSNGTVRFYLPPAAGGKVSVTVNTLGGMPIQRSAEKASGDIYKVDYPIKPGETLFTMNYSIPAADPKVYAGRILGEQSAVLIVPPGVSLAGDVTEDGVETRFNAPKYRVAAGDFKITIQGSGSFTEPAANSAAAGDDSGAPQLSESRPRIYDRLYTVLGLALGILALGFVAMYRARTSDQRSSAGAAPKGAGRG